MRLGLMRIRCCSMFACVWLFPRLVLLVEFCFPVLQFFLILSQCAFFVFLRMLGWFSFFWLWLSMKLLVLVDLMKSLFAWWFRFFHIWCFDHPIATLLPVVCCLWVANVSAYIMLFTYQLCETLFLFEVCESKNVRFGLINLYHKKKMSQTTSVRCGRHKIKFFLFSHLKGQTFVKG